MKTDTGARTSSLHAFQVKPFLRCGNRFVRFAVHPQQRRRHPEILCEAAIVGERIVTSSNGGREQRYVIQTQVRIGMREWSIALTLTNRDEMGFRMLLGRQALRGRLLVDCGGSYRLSEKALNTGKSYRELLP